MQIQIVFHRMKQNVMEKIGFAIDKREVVCYNQLKFVWRRRERYS